MGLMDCWSLFVWIIFVNLQMDSVLEKVYDYVNILVVDNVLCVRSL